CTITGLSGVGRDNLLVALYDRTDELRAQRELIAREKLATVGEIASGVAHEVNNPLAAIRMEAELLGRSSKDPDTNTTAMTITREVDRAARIVRSLLRLARRADTTPTRVQINDLVHDVAEIRQRVLRADNVEFRTRLDQSAPAVLGLAICQRVVTEVGGKLWLEDSELGGARFVVELPAAPEQVATIG